MLWVISRLVLQPENSTPRIGSGVLVGVVLGEVVGDAVSVRVAAGEGVNVEVVMIPVGEAVLVSVADGKKIVPVG